MVDSLDLLDMKLSEVSDLLLTRLCETGSSEVQVDLPGCNVKTHERFVLTVCLRKGDLE